ncbi:hypothetical protein Cgig2_027163 [Carnegiea gigantea]|uniref:CRIB domain-containing protein n=1 Tax=Carnegiea gigantea TaxID=171969 RepID=A0A9Q1QPN8_9CARY|nr:hypothetical protein Cgig2_027163 [Carnegiea gigantea]
MSVKMKGLLKGLKNISNIFGEEQEDKEIQIGYPTDVKHVAHIGWDGPSASSPTWMNEFKSSAPGNPSANSAQDSSPKKGPDLPSLPKASRRQASGDSVGSMDSPAESPKQSKSKTSRRSRHSKQKESTSPRGGESSGTAQDLPNVPKKSRRKKSKDPEGSEKRSSKSKEKGSRHGGSRHGSEDGSVSKHCTTEAYGGSSLATLKEDEVQG